MEHHPVYGRSVIRRHSLTDARWVIRIAGVPLDDVLALLDLGWSVDEILERYHLIMRTDMYRIAALRGTHAN